MKVSLKKGFGGNCILGQEAANSTSGEEKRRKKKGEKRKRRKEKKERKRGVPKFRMQNRLFYGSKRAAFNIGWPSLPLSYNLALPLILPKPAILFYYFVFLTFFSALSTNLCYGLSLPIKEK